MNEKILRKHLEKIDKKTVIELYLQARWERDIESEQNRNQQVAHFIKGSKSDNEVYICSFCGWGYHDAEDYNYCPHCGSYVRDDDADCE